MKKMIRRTAAAVLSLAIVGGVAAPVSGVSPLINTSITANAAPNAKTIEGTVTPLIFQQEVLMISLSDTMMH